MVGSQGLEPRMPEALDLQSSAVTCSARYPKKKCSDSARRSFTTHTRVLVTHISKDSHRPLVVQQNKILAEHPLRDSTRYRLASAS